MKAIELLKMCNIIQENVSTKILHWMGFSNMSQEFIFSETRRQRTEKINIVFCFLRISVHLTFEHCVWWP